MMNEIQIELRLSDGSTIPATIERRDRDATCWIRLTANKISEESTSTDYFKSFADIREKLARREIFPLCYASSRNIWPSGMARDMGKGLKAYKLQLGSRPTELVDIFTTGPDIDPVTPDEQRKFSEAWIESLKKK